MVNGPNLGLLRHESGRSYGMKEYRVEENEDYAMRVRVKGLYMTKDKE